MAVVQTIIDEVIPKSATQKWVRYQTQFSDGRVKNIKRVMAATAADDSLLSEAQAQAEEQIKNQDAQKLVSAGDVPADSGEASVWDVRKAYIAESYQIYQTRDLVTALNRFDRFYPQMKAYGDAQIPAWVAADYATALGIPESQVSAVITAWQELDGNRVAIEAYEALQ